MAKKNDSQHMQQSSKTFLWVAGLSIVGAIFTHLYLLTEHINLKFGHGGSNSLCNINDLFSCATVAASRYSELLGVPMALWGAVTNAALLVLFILHPLTSDENKGASRLNLLALSGFVALTSLIMGGISIFAISKLCPFCIVAYVLSFLAVLGIWKGVDGISNATSNATAPKFGASNLKTLAITGAVIGVFAMITNSQIQKAYQVQDLTRYVDIQISDWLSAPEIQIATVDPLTKGAAPENAVMTITEFADFRCSHCKQASPTLKAFVASHRDVRLQFQSWPLDGECNSSIPNNNGASCLLARTVFCAEKIGGAGWKAHDYVFEKQETLFTLQAVQSNLENIATASGVSPELLVACTNSPEAKKMIEQQAALGSSLNLKGTPSFFVNGKRLSGGQMLPVLQKAYEQLKSSK